MARATTARRRLLTSVGVEASRAVRATPSHLQEFASTSGTSRHPPRSHAATTPHYRRGVARRGIDEVRIQRATIKERRTWEPWPSSAPDPTRSVPSPTQMGSTTTALSTVRQRLLDRGLIYATEDSATSISPCRASTSSCDAICPSKPAAIRTTRPRRPPYNVSPPPTIGRPRQPTRGPAEPGTSPGAPVRSG